MNRIAICLIVLCGVLCGCSEEECYVSDHVSFTLFAPDYGITNYRVNLRYYPSPNQILASPPICEYNEIAMGGYALQVYLILAFSSPLTNLNPSGNDMDKIMILFQKLDDGSAFLGSIHVELSTLMKTNFGIDAFTATGSSSSIASPMGRIAVNFVYDICDRVMGTFDGLLVDQATGRTNIRLENGSCTVRQKLAQ